MIALYVSLVKDESFWDPVMNEMKKQITKQHLRLVPENFSILEEIGHLAAHYNPNFNFQDVFSELSQLERSLLFLSKNTNSTSECIFEFLNGFFKIHNFKCLPVNKYISLDNLFLDSVLSSRKGPPELLLLLFSALSKSAGLKIKVINVKHHPCVKVILKNESYIFDFVKNGKLLTKNDLLALINSGADLEKDWSDRELFSRYLAKAKFLSKRNQDFKYKVLDTLLRYQPFNLDLVTERAQLGYELGHLKETLRDISHYVMYRSPVKHTTQQLLDLYRRAKKDIN